MMILETILNLFCLFSIGIAASECGLSNDHDAILDAELVKQCKNGNRHAFNKLMLQYQKRIFNIMFRFCGDYEDAKDLTQDVFIKAYKSLGTLKEDCKFKGWIITIAANTYKNRYKYLKSRGKGKVTSIDCPRETEDGNIQTELIDTNPASDDMVHSMRLQKIVQDKLNMLKNDYKQAIVLRDIDGLSYEEIADALKISIGTVKSRIFRAREELKGHLSSVIDSL